MVHEKTRSKNPVVLLTRLLYAAVGQIINPVKIAIPTDPNALIDKLNGTVQPTATMLLQYDAVKECWVPFTGTLFTPVVASINGDVSVINTNAKSLSTYERRFHEAGSATTVVSTPAWLVVSGSFDTYFRRTLCDTSGQSFFVRLGGMFKINVPAYTMFTIDWFCGEVAIMQNSGAGNVDVCIYRAGDLAV